MAAKSALRCIGWWDASEHWHDDHCVGWIFPQQLVRPGWKRDERGQIVRYLQAGKPGVAWMGKSKCRFQDCPNPYQGSTELTDGIWVWPEGLAHYVACHDVRLPDAFVETMRSRNFRIPNDTPECQAAPFDQRFWLQWCASQVKVPAPLPDAAPIEAAQALATKLSTAACRITVTSQGGQWLVSFERGKAMSIDLLPPCSLALLTLHLHRWRVAHDAEQLSHEDMGRILNQQLHSSLPPAVAALWAFGARWVLPAALGIPYLAADESCLMLWSGTRGRGIPAFDELGWRHYLSLISPGNPDAELSRRLFRGFRQTQIE